MAPHEIRGTSIFGSYLRPEFIFKMILILEQRHVSLYVNFIELSYDEFNGFNSLLRAIKIRFTETVTTKILPSTDREISVFISFKTAFKRRFYINRLPKEFASGGLTAIVLILSNDRNLNGLTSKSDG